jgi:type VI protein secretion system component Hcp
MKKLTLQISFCCLLLPLTSHSKTQKLNQEVTHTKFTIYLNKSTPLLWQSVDHEAIVGGSFSFFSIKTTIKTCRVTYLEKEKTNDTPQILKYLLTKIMKKIKRYKQL